MFEHGFFGNVLSKYYESDSIINSSDLSLNTIKPGEFFLCVGAALLIGFLISLIYIVTHRKEGYSQSYVLTMIMLPTIVSLILLLIMLKMVHIYVCRRLLWVIHSLKLG